MPEKTRANGAHCQKDWAFAAVGIMIDPSRSMEQTASFARRTMSIFPRSLPLAMVATALEKVC